MHLSLPTRIFLGVALFTLLGPFFGMTGWVVMMLLQQTPVETLQFFAFTGFTFALLPAFVTSLLFLLATLLVPNNATSPTTYFAFGAIGALAAAVSGWVYFEAFGFAQWFVRGLTVTCSLCGLLCGLVYSRWLFPKAF